MNWTQVSTIAASIATIVATIIIGVAAHLAFLQLRAISKTRQLESMLVILRYIDDPDQRRARYFVYQHAERLRDLLDVPFTWENWNHVNDVITRLSGGTVEIFQIDSWISSLNNIAFLIREGYAPANVLTMFMKKPFLRCWKILGPYIEQRRRNRVGLSEEQSMFAYHLEYVVKQLQENQLATQH